ncbi:MAG TPA: rhodanese-like domain-containing protein [Syntrophales bacterium]|nr:rhodanese-like domain-containing protein [Syntrophales bacterium]
MSTRRLLKGLFFSLLFILLNQLIVPAASPATDVVPRITVQELKAKIDRGEDVVIIDVRAGREYEDSKIKIKGAIRISIVKLEDRISELPRDKEIVTYCT